MGWKDCQKVQRTFLWELQHSCGKLQVYAAHRKHQEGDAWTEDFLPRICKLHSVINSYVKIPMFAYTEQTDRNFMTRCQPSKGRQCIPDVILKNEGSMVGKNLSKYKCV